MIDLLRRDPTLRALPRWLIVVPMVVSFFELIRIYRLTTVVDSEPAWGDLLSAMGLWSVLALWMLLGKTAQQCTEFDLALPLSTRRLWRAHLVAVVLAGLLMLATAIGAVALPSWLLTTFLTDRMIPSTGITAMMLPAAACLCAAIAALQTPGRALYRTPLSWRQAVRVGAVITVAGAVTLWFATLSAWLAVLPALLATGLVWRIYTALPEAFVLLPRDAVTPVRRPSGAAAEGAGGNVNPPALLPAGGAGRWRTYLVFFRVLAGGVAPGQLLQVPVTMVGLPFLVPWGTALAGFWTVDTVLSFTLVPMTAYILFALMAAPLTQLRVLDPLPVSRRFIFAAAVLPGLALVSLGYGVESFTSSLSEPRALIQFQAERSRFFPRDRDSRSIVRVPADFTRLSWSGDVPDVVSPWGEVHPAWQEPVIAGSGLVLYSPFAVAEQSSIDFAAWQISRAVEEIYGRAIDWQAIRASYLEVAENGEARLREGGLTLLHDHPGLQPVARPVMAPLLLLAVALISLLATWIYLWTFRATVSASRRKFTFFALLGVMLTLHALPVAMDIAGYAEPSSVVGAVQVLMGHATAITGVFLAWAAALVIFLAAYEVVQRRFFRIEVPSTSPTGCL